MKSRKRNQVDMEALCAEVHADDGVDPREAFKRNTRDRSKPQRKTQQLCKQVAQSLELALRGFSGDAILQDLRVVSVEPVGDCGRLLVTVELATLAGKVGHDELLARLEQARGRLRCEVTASITRKRAPELCFALRPRQEVPDE